MSANRMKTLVVGATGLLGKKILKNILSEKSVDVRAMSRKGAPSGYDKKPGDEDFVEWVSGDMMDVSSLERALVGVDVVVTSANGYMKESLVADFQGNKNLVEAAAKAQIKKYVFLSIISCDLSPEVPHFHAKKVTEDAIKESGIPYVIVRAPAFLDQSPDYLADGAKAGRYVAIGDWERTRMSYCLTDDLATSLAKACTSEDDDIKFKTIDVGLEDGPKNNKEMYEIICRVINKPLSAYTLPWFLISAMATPSKWFSELAYDMLMMFLFIKKGTYVSDLTLHRKYLGASPTTEDIVTRWAVANKLK